MDPIMQGFLQTQREEGLALAADSDTLKLQPIYQNADPPQHYIARFMHCGLLRNAAGDVTRAECCDFGISLGDDYLQQVSTFEVITVLQPATLFHSNVRYPYVCLGHRFLRPGTPLVEILCRLYTLASYRLWTTNDALDGDAAEWIRNHQDRIPLACPPLKRRQIELTIHVTKTERHP